MARETIASRGHRPGGDTPSRSGLGGSPRVPPRSSRLAGGGADTAGASAAGRAHAAPGRAHAALGWEHPAGPPPPPLTFPGTNWSLLTYLKGKDLTGEQPGAPALPWNHAKATHATEQALARHKRGCRQKLRNEGRNPKRARTAAVSRRGRRGGAVGCSQPCAHAGATEVAPAKLPSGNRHCAVGTATETDVGRKGGGATPTFLSG